MIRGTRRDVEQLYQAHPYPNKTVGNNLIYDLAALIGLTLQPDVMESAHVLDAGCGTGHRLIALAKQYPDAQFLGVDMVPRCLEIASDLARYHGVRNVDFVKADLTNLTLDSRFDLVTCTGVLHHMEHPDTGLRNLLQVLTPDGLAVVWMYHAIGEHERLLQRDLIQVFAEQLRVGGASREDILRVFDFSLCSSQYGTAADYEAGSQTDQLAIDVDAFLNPIVNSYRYRDLVSLFGIAGFADIVCAGFNKLGQSRLMDPAGKMEGAFWLRGVDLIDSSQLLELFLRLSYADQITAMELLWKPTGFSTFGLASQATWQKLQSPFNHLRGI